MFCVHFFFEMMRIPLIKFRFGSNKIPINKTNQIKQKSNVFYYEEMSNLPMKYQTKKLSLEEIEVFLITKSLINWD